MGPIQTGLKNKKEDTFILPSFEMKTWNFSPVEPLRLFCSEVSRNCGLVIPGLRRVGDQRSVSHFPHCSSLIPPPHVQDAVWTTPVQDGAVAAVY